MNGAGAAGAFCVGKKGAIGDAAPGGSIGGGGCGGTAFLPELGEGGTGILPVLAVSLGRGGHAEATGLGGFFWRFESALLMPTLATGAPDCPALRAISRSPNLLVSLALLAEGGKEEVPLGTRLAAM